MNRASVAALLATLCLAAPAAAQSAPRSAEVPLADALQGPAKDAYTSAKLLFANGDFAGAETKYRQAYDLSKDPRLLFDMAICAKNVRGYARMRQLLLEYEREAGASISAEDRANVEAALAAIKDLVGTVKLTVSEPGATVLVDKATIGTTPLPSPLQLDLGKHALTVRKSGFEAVERALDVAGGSEVPLAIVLVARSHVGQLVIEADPRASVAIDGTVVATGRFEDRIASGAHTVRVTETGRVPFVAQVDLRDGETRTVQVTLEEEHRSTVWPWFVAGGAVVAGAVVGGYFLFKPSDTTTAPPLGKLGSVQLTTFGK